MNSRGVRGLGGFEWLRGLGESAGQVLALSGQSDHNASGAPDEACRADDLSDRLRSGGEWWGREIGAGQLDVSNREAASARLPLAAPASDW
jgi:hypothetical protein